MISHLYHLSDSASIATQDMHTASVHCVGVTIWCGHPSQAFTECIFTIGNVASHKRNMYHCGKFQ